MCVFSEKYLSPEDGNLKPLLFLITVIAIVSSLELDPVADHNNSS